MKSLWRWAAPAALLSTMHLVGCGGGIAVEGNTLAVPPRGADGFPEAHLYKDVYMEVRFDSEHKARFDWDMLGSGILPIQLNMGLRRTDDASAHTRIDPSNTGLRLYLSDGTVLEEMDAGEVADRSGDEDRRKRITSLALDMSVVDDWENRAGQAGTYVFFNMRGLKEANVRGSRLTFIKGRTPVAVDLRNALLSFNISENERTRPIYVGIGYK